MFKKSQNYNELRCTEIVKFSYKNLWHGFEGRFQNSRNIKGLLDVRTFIAYLPNVFPGVLLNFKMFQRFNCLFLVLMIPPYWPMYTHISHCLQLACNHRFCLTHWFLACWWLENWGVFGIKAEELSKCNLMITLVYLHRSYSESKGLFLTQALKALMWFITVK